MTVMDAVKQTKTYSWMRKGAIKVSQELILSNETVIYAIIVNTSRKAVSDPSVLKIKDMDNGVFVVTNQRILFVNDVARIGHTLSIRLADIRSVEEIRQPILSYLLVQGIAQHIWIYANNDNIRSLHNAIEQALASKTNRPATVSASTPTATSELDVDQLKKLKELYDAGILTEEEFAAKKAQILGV